MGWTCYLVELEARSPVHIGWHSLGLIERTRYYIPGRAIWGGMAAGLAPVLNAPAGVPQMYRQMEACLASNFRTSYFFPLDGAGKCLRPRYEPSGLKYGSMTAAAFENRFVYSQSSAALDPASFTALDGALHEFEFLASPIGKLVFQGYWLACGPLTRECLLKGAENLRIGADRKYGWGELSIRSCAAIPDNRIFSDFTLRVDVHCLGPTVELTGKAFLPAHLSQASAVNGPCGDLELLGGRSWGEGSGSGQFLEKPDLFWAPGSQVSGGQYQIAPQGTWTRISA